MEAGRDMDQLIAEKVFGYAILTEPHCDECAAMGEPMFRDENGVGPIPNYSTSIADAWEVVEKLSMTTKQYWTMEYFSTGAHVEFSVGGQSYEAEEETMPHAICLAALKAMRPAGQEGG